MTRNERERVRYAELMQELCDDPELLREIRAVLRENGYGTIYQLGDAADDFPGRFVEVWRMARQRRQAVAG